MKLLYKLMLTICVLTVVILIMSILLKRQETVIVIDPSLSIHSIKGKHKETILLTPNSEPLFKATNFIPPLSSYAQELAPDNKASIVNLDVALPIYVYKHGSKYLYFDIEPASGKYNVRYDGKKIKTSDNVDFHDFVVHQDRTFTYMEYLPDSKDRAIHLGLKRVDSEGRVLWSWDSRRHISPENFIKEPKSTIEVEEQLPLFELLTRVREKYSKVTLDIVGSSKYERLVMTKLYLPFISRKVKLFDSYINLIDHIHANSIQYLENEKYILVSARHLDALFVIELKTGLIVWSVGGPYSRFTPNRVVGDPRGGFSHQHDAFVYKNRLYLFDNANMQLGLPSRAVVYTFDMKNPNNSRFLFEYLEPYGKRRLSMGSIQPLDEDRILIGWGGVSLPERSLPSAAASIVNMKNKKTEWQVDYKPGWTSYRVRAYQ